MTFDSQSQTSTMELRGYGQVAMDLIRVPRNLGYLKPADAVGRATTHHCAGRVEVQLKVEGPERRIRRARFVSSGCPTVTATLSLVTGLIEGRRVSSVLDLSSYEILLRLGAVPRETEGCVRSAVRAVEEAARSYIDQLVDQETVPGHRRVDPALVDFRLCIPA